MAIKYGLASAEKALAYWKHLVLGAGLRKCIELVLAVKARSANDIFGSHDDMKFRSCLTLFDAAVANGAMFGQALAKFYSGQRDQRLLELLSTV